MRWRENPVTAEHHDPGRHEPITVNHAAAMPISTPVAYARVTVKNIPTIAAAGTASPISSPKFQCDAARAQKMQNNTIPASTTPNAIPIPSLAPKDSGSAAGGWYGP